MSKAILIGMILLLAIGISFLGMAVYSAIPATQEKQITVIDKYGGGLSGSAMIIDDQYIAYSLRNPSDYPKLKVNGTYIVKVESHKETPILSIYPEIIGVV
jgi:hypothetical protein